MSTLKYENWSCCGMPVIGPHAVSCVLYKNVDTAKHDRMVWEQRGASPSHYDASGCAQPVRKEQTGAQAFMLDKNGGFVPVTDDGVTVTSSTGKTYQVSRPAVNAVKQEQAIQDPHLAEALVDLVARPPHYTQHPSGIECIIITEHMGFNLGNAVKYIWRADLKNNADEDLRKAIWYLERELLRRKEYPAR